MLENRIQPAPSLSSTPSQSKIVFHPPVRFHGNTDGRVQLAVAQNQKNGAIRWFWSFPSAKMPMPFSSHRLRVNGRLPFRFFRPDQAQQAEPRGQTSRAPHLGSSGGQRAFWAVWDPRESAGEDVGFRPGSFLQRDPFLDGF